MATQPNLRAQFPSGPLLDEATGEVLPVWRAYFASLYVRTGGAAGASSDTTQLQADLDAEETARQAADLALTTGLAAERAAREAADSAEAAARTGADAQMLPKAGGTMAGMITLSATAPTNPRHAVGKSYVDGAVGGAAYAPLASPMFTGNPTAPTPSPGDADTSLATTAFVAVAVAPTQNNVGRNLIHNSMFYVAQRGVGPFTADVVFTLDRWLSAKGTGSASVQQGVLSDTQRAEIGDEAAAFSLYNVFTGGAAAGEYVALSQGIEGVRRLAGRTVTLSFWAAGTVSLKLGASFYQAFGSGGSPSGLVTVNGQSVTLTPTWARYSLTFSIPSVAGKTLGTAGNDCTQLYFWLSSGATNNVTAGSIGVQSGTIQLWGVQLEIGSVATPLEKPDPQVDLANCHRFFQVVKASARFVAGGASQFMDCTVTFPTMRAAPTIVPGAADASANISSSALTTMPSTTNCARFEIVSTAAGDCYQFGRAFYLTADL